MGEKERKKRARKTQNLAVWELEEEKSMDLLLLSLWSWELERFARIRFHGRKVALSNLSEGGGNRRGEGQ